MNMYHAKVNNHYLSISLLIFLPLALHGCFDSSNVLAQRDLTAPGAILVGEPIAWSVVMAPGEELRATVFDAKNKVVFHSGFEAVSNFTWTPFQPGIHLIDVRIRREDGVIEIASGTVDVMPRGTPLVTGTDHPLVALYTYVIPRGLQGQVVYTCETCPDEVKSRTFATLLMKGSGAEVGTLLPALRPENTYSVQHDIFDGADLVSRGPILNHTTGPIPISVQLQQISVLVPPVNPGLNALLTVTPVFSPTGEPIPQMVDETAGTVWYDPMGGLLTRPTRNGWALIRESFFAVGPIVEIIDYTGQVLRRVTQESVQHQLTPLGFSRAGGFHHEMRALPNDRYATLMVNRRLVTDVQGPGTVDVIGDLVVVLDDRMGVVWTWDAFEHLDLARQALLGDVVLDANDWTHANAIDYDPRDGNLIVSLRNQSWVVKITYENGAGDGHVVWRLGRDGDFSTASNDPQFWFSYQHDANVLPDGRLALYDNGNERFSVDENATSRGQVYILDEKAMTAELDINIDLGAYSGFIGSAAQAPDGSMHFNSGVTGMHEDYARDGSLRGAFHTPTFVYRSFRMMDPFDLSPN